jgi:MFS family permease
VGAVREGWRARLRAGAAYVRDHPALRRLLAAQGLALVFLTAVLPVEVVFAKATLGAGDAGYGALLASWGAGMVIGAGLFARTRRQPLARVLTVSTLAIGCAYGLMAAAPTIGAACAAAALGGAGNGLQWVAFVTAVQTATAPAMQARVMSLMEALAAATPGVGFALGGLLAAAASPRVAFAVAAAGVLAAAGYGLTVTVLVTVSGRPPRSWMRARIRTTPARESVRDGRTKKQRSARATP